VWHISGSGEAPTVFRWRNVRIRDHLKTLVLEGRIILKWMFKK